MSELPAENNTAGILLPSGKPVAPQKRQREAKNVPDSLLILGITAFCYGCVFSFEGGYCQVFGVPWDLIRLDATTLLVRGLFAISLLILVYQLATILFFASKIGTNRGGRSGFTSWAIGRVFLICLILPIGFFEGFKSVAFLSPFCIAAFEIGSELVFPLFAMRDDPKKRPYLYHFMDFRDAMKRNPSPSLLDEADKQGIGAPLMLFLGVNICLYYCFNIGKQYAIHSDVFLFRSNPRPEVVLRIYGGNAITARIDGSRNVYPELRIVKIEGETNDFVLSRIGQLTPILPDGGSVSKVIDLIGATRLTNVVSATFSNAASKIAEAPSTNGLSKDVPSASGPAH